VDENTAENQNDPNLRYIGYPTSASSSYGSVDVMITGPSFFIRLENLTLGLFSNFRTSAGTFGVPEELAYSNYNNIPRDQPFSIDGFNLTGASWLEIGFSLSKTIFTGTNYIAVGANLKYNIGYEGVYLQSPDNLTLTKMRRDSLRLGPSEIHAAFTTSNDDGQDFSLSRNGSGYGIDLGLSVSDGDANGYTWKIGVSINDLGLIDFTENAELHEFNTGSEYVLTNDNLTGDLSESAQSISDVVYGTRTASLASDAFSVGLPTALSLQMDFRLYEDFFVGGFLVQRVPLSNQTLYRDNIVAVVPRFEMRFISVSVPISVYNYKKLFYGLSLRLGYLTIGTDRIAGLLNSNEFYGADIYAGLKINGFQFGGGKNGFSAGSGNGNKGKVKCYRF
jgi:hypothetical protein